MKVIEKQLTLYEEEYKKFMGINQFPKYELQFKEVSLNVADKYGFDSVAFTAYQTQTNKHTLVVSTNLKLAKHLIFHEFTHIYDSYRYVKGDKVRYAGLSGFTEYHASQVELVQLLNVENIDDTFAFSMDSIINTISGKKSVQQYIDERQQGRYFASMIRHLWKSTFLNHVMRCHRMSHDTYDIVILAKEKMIEAIAEKSVVAFSMERGGADAKKTKASLFSSWLSEFDGGEISRGTCEAGEP